MSERLTRLEPGQLVPFGGDHVAVVPPELAAAFEPGDRLVVVQETGDLLHIPLQQHRIAAAAVDAAVVAFSELRRRSDDEITELFEQFAANLDDEASFAPIAQANQHDVDRAVANGRPVGRLVLSERMRRDMVDGLRSWRDAVGVRDEVRRRLEHRGWSVEQRVAPLGVVAFVFEGRPNVFADAVGVLRSGNTTVLRIGSDALETARAICQHALEPALVAAGLPPGAVSLVDSVERSAGWALFSDRRVALAVARGSGTAVGQLGAVARQSGIAVSLHGTGGAWLVVGDAAEPGRLAAAIANSLDRKVCNTLNVVCVQRRHVGSMLPVVLEAVEEAASALGTEPVLHVETSSLDAFDQALRSRQVVVHRAGGPSHEPFITPLDEAELGTEWEWDQSPELSIVVVDDVEHAVELFNRHSPRFVASLVSEDPGEQDRFYDHVDAPFVGDGFTRWVDGQYALGTPELGLSNWQGGRLLARGGILSGDGVHTVRYRARVEDAGLRR